MTALEREVWGQGAWPVAHTTQEAERTAQTHKINQNKRYSGARIPKEFTKIKPRCVGSIKQSSFKKYFHSIVSYPRRNIT